MPDVDCLLDVDTQFRVLTNDVGRVEEGECLFCYLVRMLEMFGCSGSHNWTLRWCDAQRSSTGWVLPWLRRRHGYCDCEVIVNVFGDGARSRQHLRLRCEASFMARR